MAAAIKVIGETVLDGVGTAPSATPRPNGADLPPVIQADPRVLAALAEAGNRLAAVEQVAQNLPRAAHHVAMLLRALGAKVLAFIGLVGCLGLAAELGPNPTWQGLAILGIVVVGVQLPLVASAYWGRS